jgi:aspartyl-tRNA(Asn)/glutamyl-tRNA(Gln) amidotransferase subunit C
MGLTKDEVRHIAALAHLALSDEEIALYQEQLSTILDYAARLQEIDTSDVPPTATVLPLVSVLREDVPTEPLPRDEALANAPDAEANCFFVPSVLPPEKA